MIIGEAPGKEEDARGLPFTGPAGQLLDKIWTAAGMDTNDWYITNVIHCRPIAPKDSGKQNLTPKTEQLERCKPYWQNEIRLLIPKVIVLMGNVALQTVIENKQLKIGQMRGKKFWHTFEYGWGTEIDVIVFPMIHPAAILHATGGPMYSTYRAQTWEDVQKLKQILIEEGI